eukprot:391734-Rhodomonas_salina.1
MGHAVIVVCTRPHNSCLQLRRVTMVRACLVPKHRRLLVPHGDVVSSAEYHSVLLQCSRLELLREDISHLVVSGDVEQLHDP